MRRLLTPNPPKEGVWNRRSYFDAGGGEIWMVTCSVPVRDAEGVFALITTDLPAWKTSFWASNAAHSVNLSL